MSKKIQVERRGAVALLTVSRPEVLNAIDVGTLAELDAAWQHLEADAAVRVVIITGAGERAFVAGGDIPALAAMDMRQGRAFVERGNRLLWAIGNSRIITIAAVNGYALGGGTELALACDLRLAAEHARFGLPEARVGLMPGWGGTQRIARAIGLTRAKHLIFTGEQITSAQALGWGLVNQVLPAGELLPTCLEIAERIVASSPVAVQQCKLSLNRGSEIPLEYGLRLEVEAWVVNFGTRDRVEGLKAFAEKRPPQWKGE